MDGGYFFEGGRGTKGVTFKEVGVLPVHAHKLTLSLANGL